MSAGMNKDIRSDIAAASNINGSSFRWKKLYTESNETIVSYCYVGAIESSATPYFRIISNLNAGSSKDVRLKAVASSHR